MSFIKFINRRLMLKSSFLSSLTFVISCSTNKIKRGPSSIFSGWFEDSINKISNTDINALKEKYDLLIVGSGYGASVIAHEMSTDTSNSNICIIERGKEFSPGDFPKDFTDVISQLKNPINPLGLLDQNMGISKDSDLDIISANGLGGTSLINAAIAIRPTKEVFLQKEWPTEIRDLVSNNERDDLGDLEKYFLKAENNLGSNFNNKVIANTEKSSVFSRAITKLNTGFGHLRLNITYKNSTRANDLERKDCTLCGDCCSGCNVGAKNILPYNYIHTAKENGCEIHTEIEVTGITKEENGYKVNLRETKALLTKERTVFTRNLVLGAGSHGSSLLLLKAQANGLSMSKTLGSKVSLNADVLGFCYNGNKKTNAVGIGTSARKKAIQPSVGPGIGTYANHRLKNKEKGLSKQFLLLEGSIPSPLTQVISTALANYVYQKKDEIQFNPDQWERVNTDKKITFNSNKLNINGALNYSTLFLACGHDSSAGEYRLDIFNNLKVLYKDVHKEPFFKMITDEMKKTSKELGGLYLDNPRTSIFNGKMMATHPLGGCPMGEDHKKGSVNHKGQVFTSSGKVHEGLYVVDASIIPRSLGATPLLTISALAHRISEHMKKDKII